MRPYFRPLTVAALAATPLLGGCFALDAKFKETRTSQVAHAAGSAVSVRTANGNISIGAAKQDQVSITANLRAVTQERLTAMTIIAEREPSGVLAIRVEWPEGKRLGNEGCDFTITLPDAAGVTADSSNGRIEITSLSGKADLRTSNGRIIVTDHAGDVHADTSNGRIVMTNITGSVHADSSNGDLELKNIGGSVFADTSNGDVTIALDPASIGPITADSSNGSVVLVLGPAFKGTLEVSTSNGSIRHDVKNPVSVTATGKRSARIVLTEGGEPSRATTSNGSITVNRGS